MEEFDEDKAAALMAAASGMAPSDALNEAALEVLDLIYDYYDEHGDLDISLDDDDDDEPDAAVADIVAYVSRQLAKHPAAVALGPDALAAMVEAEIAYEESLL